MRKPPHSVRRVLAALTLLGSTFTSLAAEAPRPNVLYLFADDLGWGTIGANGQTTLLTPNLDALAASGINFTRGYGCPVCSPARSSQQTGFHQGHTWTDRNDPAATKAMRQEDPTIGDVLSAAGYRTGYWGKWGYGADQTLNDPAINNPQTLPINHGYDKVLAELHHVRAHTFFQPTLWRTDTDDPAPTTALIPNTIPSNDTDFPTYPAYHNDPGYPATAYCDDSYARAALDFVRTEAQTPAPFFALIAFQIPHTPLGDVATLPKWFDAYAGVAGSSAWSNDAKRFAAMVTRMDAHIGNLIAALSDPNNDGDQSDSVLDNTLIIFASDNGGQNGTPKTFFNANGPLRGSKGTVYEGGIRVPTVMSWSGTIAPGQTTDQIVDVTDVFPTLCELAGMEAPVGLDGISIAPILTGLGHQRPREFYIHEDQPNWSIIRGDYKLTKQGGLELYNLATDPNETSDLAATLPALRDELHAIALAERVEEGDSFANTHHDWTGTDGAATNDANNWSDTAAPNPIIDTGAPRASWNALMENTTASNKSAIADADLDTLGIEIRGASPSAKQILELGDKTLTGRNEIRLSAHSAVTLDNGTLSSQRWVDLRANASLTGAGTVEALLYNAGSLAVTQSTGTTIPGGGTELIANGGFETGVDVGAGDYSYTTLADWTTDGPDPLKDGAKPNSPKSGLMRSLIQAGTGATSIYNLVQDTGTPIVLGDTYALSFWHRGFLGWESGDAVRVNVFYEDGPGNRVDLLSDTVALTNGTWLEATFNVPAVTDPNAAGANLQLSLGPDLPADAGTEFASLDDVSLIRNGGEVTISGDRTLAVSGDYHEFEGSSLDLTLAGTGTAGDDYARLSVGGDATLAGSLAVTLDPAYTPQVGDSFTILTANTLNGRFAHADDMIISGGHWFRIAYSANTVTLAVVAVAANGTPHWWLDQFGLNTLSYDLEELLDHDHDGIPTWSEFIAGTDPTDPSSGLFLVATGQSGNSAVALTWSSVAQHRYWLEHSFDLQSFVEMAGPFAAVPPENRQSVPVTAAREFFRVRVERK